MAHPTSQTFGKETSPLDHPEYRVEFTRLVQHKTRQVYLQWTLRNPPAADGFTFTLYRSGSSNGPWEQIPSDVTQFLDTFNYVDNNFEAPRDQSAPGLDMMRNALYYRLVVTHLAGSPVECVGLLENALDKRRRAIVKKLRRDAEIKIRKGSGTEVAILKRKWWGEPCVCRSSVGQTTRSHCAVCHGTGIVSGYWDPVYTYGKRTATSVDEQTSSRGVTERQNILATIPYVPQVMPRDILVFTRDNKRYIVDRVQPTEIHTVDIHQELIVSELSPSSVEYDVAVDPWHQPEWF